MTSGRCFAAIVVGTPVHDDALQAVGGTRQGKSIPFHDEMAPTPLGEWLEAHPTRWKKTSPRLWRACGEVDRSSV